MQKLNVKKILEDFMKEAEHSFELHDETNLLDLLDSVELVGLVMFTEEYVSKNLEATVQLADENTFDVSSSPLRSISEWCLFVNKQINT